MFGYERFVVELGGDGDAGVVGEFAEVDGETGASGLKRGGADNRFVINAVEDGGGEFWDLIGGEARVRTENGGHFCVGI